MVKTKVNLVQKLIDMEDEVQDYIGNCNDDRIIAPLVNVKGAISHLKDSHKIVEHSGGER